MKLLHESINKGGHILNMVQNKDVVLILGKTGSGKSTLIQGIANWKLQATIHETSYLSQHAEKEVFQAVDALPDFKIEYAKKSMTKSINAFSVKQMTVTAKLRKWFTSTHLALEILMDVRLILPLLLC